MRAKAIRWIMLVTTLLATLFISHPATTQTIRIHLRSWAPAQVARVNIPDTASLDFEKTVGLNPNTCAQTDSITVAPGTQVTYCYFVHNTGTESLLSHDLVDDKLGPILTAFPFILLPGSSAFLTQTMTVQSDVINTATWTARPSSSVPTDDTDSAIVYATPPELLLEKTVGINPNACASSDVIFLNPGTKATYCYLVTNTGDHALEVHTLEDSQLGVILNGFAYTLYPDASAFLTQTVSILTSVTNTATWTAWTESGAEASYSDSATVISGNLRYLPLVIKPSPP